MVPDPSSWLLLCRRVRFGDTDAAGVLHAPRLLRWCHEAYEESLERYGISAAQVFPTPGHPLAVALPIVHCQADFRRPLVCGDPLAIRLAPRRLDSSSFEVRYAFVCDDQPAAEGLTRHVAIAAASRQRCALPEPLNRWLEASSLGGVQTL
ncbi:thioesterase superfamily [Cyanobium sp. PCC 7001]|uniref:acyl-CoA thioesterase n=1 Tax=Cyanobium sp. PCC 7001 TaxID=180281 RepID=UPI0001805AE0|nr:thioesterase family protein [Cyanobium sp. PCC 7001]EDY39334.1 thioesterase superfamily [Cyanobium sp. PCC 7001]